MFGWALTSTKSLTFDVATDDQSYPGYRVVLKMNTLKLMQVLTNNRAAEREEGFTSLHHELFHHPPCQLR